MTPHLLDGWRLARLLASACACLARGRGIGVARRVLAADRYADLVGDLLATTGSVRMRMPGTSMWPAIRPWEVRTVDAATARELSVGDVVLYRHLGRLRAHRLVGYPWHVGGEIYLRLQGDNLDREDPPIPLGAVLGRVRTPRRPPIRAQECLAVMGPLLPVEHHQGGVRSCIR